MSEYLIIACKDSVIVSFRCNRKNTAVDIGAYLTVCGWNATWYSDPPLIGQLVYKDTD